MNDIRYKLVNAKSGVIVKKGTLEELEKYTGLRSAKLKKMVGTRLRLFNEYYITKCDTID